MLLTPAAARLVIDRDGNVVRYVAALKSGQLFGEFPVRFAALLVSCVHSAEASFRLLRQRRFGAAKVVVKDLVKSLPECCICELHSADDDQRR